MIRLDKHTFKNGVVKTQVRIVDGYRDEFNKSKQRTVKNYGYLEDQDNPEEFLASLRELDRKRIKDKRITINTISKLPFYEDKSSTSYLFGHRYLESIYDELHLEKIFNNIDSKCAYNPNEIFKFFVIQRILNPDSKRATYQTVETLFNKKKVFSLDQVYRSLDIFSNVSNNIQKQLNEEIKLLVGRDTSNVYFDSTNYYFQKDLESPDKYKEVIPLVKGKTNIKNQKIIELIDENGENKQFKVEQ